MAEKLGMRKKGKRVASSEIAAHEPDSAGPPKPSLFMRLTKPLNRVGIGDDLSESSERGQSVDPTLE